MHFLALDQESLPKHDLNGLFAEYLPAEITHELYPNLVAGRDYGSDHRQPRAARRLRLAGEFAEYKKVAKFVDAFFSKIDQFNNPSRHPKWREVNLSAEMPGWVRYKPAADWLAAHKNQPVSANADGATGLSTLELRQAFDKFMQTYASASGGKELSAREREALFVRFKESLCGIESAAGQRALNVSITGTRRVTAPPSTRRRPRASCAGPFC